MIVSEAVRTRPHGTNAKYVLERCRCEECREAKRLYMEDLKRRREENGGSVMVEAGPIRAHVDKLRCGTGRGARRNGDNAAVSLKRIAKVSGVPHGSLSKLIYGDHARGSPPSRKVRRDTARKLLALRIEDLMLHGTLVPPGDTMCYLEELHRFGIPNARIADALPRPPACRLLQIGRYGTGYIEAGNKKAIWSLHWRLWLTSPEFRWFCECEVPRRVWGIFENAEGIHARSYTEGWRYSSERAAMVEAAKIAPKSATLAVSLHPDGSYRWYPSPDYVPAEERIVRRRLQGQWRPRKSAKKRAAA